MSTRVSPLAEALAFFKIFQQGDWRSGHVRTPDLEIFLARDSGHLNPLASSQGSPDRAPSATRDEPIGASLRAPHLGTLVELAPIGAPIVAGQTYATLAVLDDRIELASQHCGVVSEHLQALQQLVEYDQLLLTLR